MKYTFTIRDNATGEERLYPDTFDWDDEGAMLFMYTEGNYACDCNRELFWARVGGEPEPSEDDNACGSERFSIPHALRDDGETVKIDDPIAEKKGGSN